MKSIIGTSKLVSLELVNKQETIKPFGDDVKGLLFYEENGYLSGIISGEDRPNVNSTAMMGIFLGAP